MKKYIIIQVFVLICFAFLSCDKYLDIQSDTRLVIPNSIVDLQKILDNNSAMNFQKGTKCEEITDDFYLTETNYNRLKDPDRSAYIWSRYETLNSSNWSKAYSVVYNANLVLDRLDKVKRTDENAVSWDRVKATALFYRANHYLTLLWTYAKVYDAQNAKTDLGIVLRNTSDFNVKSIRSTVELGYRTVIEDLKEAAGRMPDNSAHVLQPNLKAVFGLLSRAYLSMSKYDSAYHYADLALDKEFLLLDFNDEQDVKSSANFPFLSFNKETIFYEEMQSGGFMTISNHTVAPELFVQYEVNDLRKIAFFKSSSDGTVSFKGNYTGNNFWFNGLSNNELLLTRAECFARSGKLKEAQNDLNKLLEKRYRIGTFVPYVFVTKEDALNIILAERRKELLFRGLRFMDIKRYNLEGRNIVLRREIDGAIYELAPNDNWYAHPLPDDIVQIAGIPQNSY